MLRGLFRSAEQDPINDLSQSIELIKQTFESAPFSPVKKKVMNAVLDCLQNKLAAGSYSQLSFMLSAEQKMKFVESVLHCAYEHDDVFLNQVTQLCLTLSEESRLRKVTMDAVNEAKQELKMRRENVHHYSFIGVVALTAFTLWRNPPVGMILLLGEVLACMKIDFKTVQNSMLEFYDSTGYMTVKKDGQETRELKSTYDAAERRPGRR